MAIAKKFTPRKSATVAKPAPTPAPAPAPRKRVAVDNTAAAMHHAAGAPDAAMVDNLAIADAEYAKEKQVEVFVKKAFRFTTGDHVVHDIPEGTQTVPQSWFEHSYFKAHGVRETEPRK